MATDKTIVEDILNSLSRVAEATARPMMGDYVVYLDGKVAGVINDGELYIKATPFGEAFAPELDKRSAYPGAKPSLAVAKALLNNSEWLNEFLLGTIAQLPKKR